MVDTTATANTTTTTTTYNSAERSYDFYVGIAGTVWVGSFCVLWLKRLYRCSKQRQQSLDYRRLTLDIEDEDPSGLVSSRYKFDQIDANSSIGTSPNINHLDESQWYTWTVTEVMEWLLEHGLPPQHHCIIRHGLVDPPENETFQDPCATPSATTTTTLSSTDSYFHTTVVPRLVWEGVDGRVLEGLDHDALRHMEVPYGLAAPLLEQIRTRLIHRYPRREDHRSNNSSDQGRGWTLEDPYDSNEPNNHDRQNQKVQQQPLFGPSDTHHTYHSKSSREPYLDKNEMEQMRAAMQERYGLELPELASPAPPTPSLSNRNTNDDKNQSDIFQRTHKEHNSSLDSTNKESSRDGVASSSTGTESDVVPSPSLLALMPPHIRDIVQEKPHLWQQLQRIQQQSRQQINTATNAATTTAMEETTNGTNHHDEPALSENASRDSSTAMIPPEILQNLPPRVKEVALRNPDVFLQMLQSKQQQLTLPKHQQPGQGVSDEGENNRQSKHRWKQNSLNVIAEDAANDELDGEEEHDELVQLLPKQSNTGIGTNQDLLRQRPGF